MTHVSRLVCILTLVALAIGVVAYSAGSTTMASAMMAADADMYASADCDACGDSESGLKSAACDFVCNAAGMVTLFASAAANSTFASPDSPQFQLTLAAEGLSGPPAKHPPRIYL